jgi:hypothetical protein
VEGALATACPADVAESILNLENAVHAASSPPAKKISD